MDEGGNITERLQERMREAGAADWLGRNCIERNIILSLTKDAGYGILKVRQ
jgi:hypothetical protein